MLFNFKIFYKTLIPQMFPIIIYLYLGRDMKAQAITCDVLNELVCVCVCVCV